MSGSFGGLGSFFTQLGLEQRWKVLLVPASPLASNNHISSALAILRVYVLYNVPQFQTRKHHGKFQAGFITASLNINPDIA